ncbi:hypothetical protein C2845_PM13G12970 [Panicum miliaceum]|uniref:Uncharacterized protein n=1 Tax=Panicum miliaceum TaxID=4540 RepID=A0A3L6RPB6_PANMI|nr:hypothetical protein C2845_PM13G12970 [Panicum miliaceum]
MVGTAFVVPEQNLVPLSSATPVADVPPDFEKVLLSDIEFAVTLSDKSVSSMLNQSFIADQSVLFFLASIAIDQKVAASRVFIGPALPPAGLPLVPYSDSEDDEDVMEIEALPASAYSNKRHARKLMEPLEQPFVRRSRRLNPELDGFRTEASRGLAADIPPVYSISVANASSVAPHLSINNIRQLRPDIFRCSL